MLSKVRLARGEKRDESRVHGGEMVDFHAVFSLSELRQAAHDKSWTMQQ